MSVQNDSFKRQRQALLAKKNAVFRRMMQLSKRLTLDSAYEQAQQEARDGRLKY